MPWKENASRKASGAPVLEDGCLSVILAKAVYAVMKPERRRANAHRNACKTPIAIFAVDRKVSKLGANELMGNEYCVIALSNDHGLIQRPQSPQDRPAGASASCG